MVCGPLDDLSANVKIIFCYVVLFFCLLVFVVPFLVLFIFPCPLHLSCLVVLRSKTNCILMFLFVFCLFVFQQSILFLQSIFTLSRKEACELSIAGYKKR